jgi:4-diphosphocytidyl-2-C-methyl-D-erythritol kinase
MTVRAYAKINLGLRILRKREDGYHDIETVFHRINWFDEMTFAPTPSIVLHSSDTSVPTDERNLCVRTALLLQQHAKVNQGASIVLKKNIPIGAGLGGGSADAAATLLALNALWQLNISSEILRSFALQLGSDVPYFLKEGTAYATGRGEILEYFNVRMPYWIVVVYPNIQSSTAWAYQHVEIPNPRPQIPLIESITRYIDHPEKLSGHVTNDFEPLITRTHNEIARVKQALLDAGAVFAQMSGSGSSVYGLFNDEGQAKAIAKKFDGTYPTSITPPNFTASHHP